MSSFLRKVVRNDAMKEDPPEIYGWRVYALAVSACFGGMIFGVDVGWNTTQQYFETDIDRLVPLVAYCAWPPSKSALLPVTRSTPAD